MSHRGQHLPHAEPTGPVQQAENLRYLADELIRPGKTVFSDLTMVASQLTRQADRLDPKKPS